MQKQLLWQRGKCLFFAVFDGIPSTTTTTYTISRKHENSLNALLSVQFKPNLTKLTKKTDNNYKAIKRLFQRFNVFIFRKTSEFKNSKNDVSNNDYHGNSLKIVAFKCKRASAIKLDEKVPRLVLSSLYS